MNPLAKLLLLISLMSIPALAALTGTGTELDPYLISTYQNLKEIKNSPDSYYKLTANIDASASKTENDGRGFEPIVGSTTAFTGTFDGQNFIIENLWINDPTLYRAGLFGNVSSGAVLKNVGITGEVRAAGLGGLLVGEAYAAQIEQCWSSGTVSVEESSSGGLIGSSSQSTISKCYSTASVTGERQTGGFIGLVTYGSITNSFAAGDVYSSYTDAGGFIGQDYSVTVSNCYALGSSYSSEYYGRFSGKVVSSSFTNVLGNRENSLSGIVRATILDTVTAFMTDSVEMAALLDTTIWSIISGTYPALKGMPAPATATGDVATSIADINDLSAYLANDIDHDGNTPTAAKWTHSKMNSTGDSLWVFYSPGTILPHGDTLWGAAAQIAVPYTYPIALSSYEDLKSIGNDYRFPLNAPYVLTQNIDASLSFSEGGFTPIRGLVNGSLNGQGNSINNLYIFEPNNLAVGLFRALSENSFIKNLSIDADVTGSGSRTGTLVGYCNASVTKIIANGTVNNGGGIVGRLAGTMDQCISTVKVISGYGGGLVGYLYPGTISNSYFAGKIVDKKKWSSGITVNMSASTLTNVLTIGKVPGGPATVPNINSSATGCYWSPEFSGAATGVGATSLTLSELADQNSYPEFSFGDIWEMYAGAPMPLLAAMNNPPIAFDDTLASQADLIDTAAILSNDYDNTVGSVLTLRFEGTAPVNSSGDTLFVSYQVGEVTSEGDTIWGGYATITLPSSIPDTIAISSYDELKKIGTDFTYPLYGNYILTQDIDASLSTSENSGSGFSPIGSMVNRFRGSFDGRGYKISNLTIQRKMEDNMGLFAVIDTDGSVRNLEVSGSIAGNYSVGILAGTHYGTIENCQTNGVITGERKLGGMAGECYGTITSSSANVDITGVFLGFYYGGFSGYIYNGAVISSCYSTGSISGGRGTYIGGFAGYISGGTVSRSFCSGSLSGTKYVGGFLGNGDGSTISDCYTRSNVTGERYVGGFIGDLSSSLTIENAYATGVVSGDYLVGGFVGSYYGSNTTYTSCYWDSSTAGQTTDVIAVAKTTAEMKTVSTFTGWDMPSVWCMDDGDEYPMLRWSASEIIYKTDGNGTITGDTIQYVAKSSSYGIPSIVTNPVTAAGVGEYLFNDWSDRIATNARSDSGSIGDTTFTALFNLITVTLDTTHSIQKDTVTTIDSVYNVDSDTVVTTIKTENWIDTMFARTDSLSTGISFWFNIDTTVSNGSKVISTVVDTLTYIPTITVTNDTTHSITKDTVTTIDSVYSANSDTVVTTIKTENWIDTMFARTDSLSTGISFWFNIDTMVSNGSNVISTVVDTLTYISTITVTNDTTHSITKDTVTTIDSVYSVGSDTVVTTIKTENWIDTQFARTDSLSDGVSYWFIVDTTVTNGSNDLGTIADTLGVAVAILDGGEYRGEVNGISIAPNPATPYNRMMNIVVKGTNGASVRVSIFDNLGHLIDEQSEDIYVNGTHRFIWDLTNRYGVSVGSGSYVAIAVVTHRDGSREMFRKMIGVQR